MTWTRKSFKTIPEEIGLPAPRKSRLLFVCGSVCGSVCVQYLKLEWSRFMVFVLWFIQHECFEFCSFQIFQPMSAAFFIWLVVTTSWVLIFLETIWLLSAQEKIIKVKHCTKTSTQKLELWKKTKFLISTETDALISGIKLKTQT